MNVGIVGITGYTGVELVRLISGHPELKLVMGAAGSSAGQPLTAVWPSLEGLVSLDIESVEQGPIERVDRGIAVQPTAAPVLPGAGHRRQAADRMHLRRPVARARETVAAAQKGALRAAPQPG